ncbi:hypothetical protein Btru_010622 [Bulinus truncatus]|nr:hypothetical protein Btru_010622 [Bulinus truncatus]
MKLVQNKQLESLVGRVDRKITQDELPNVFVDKRKGVEPKTKIRLVLKYLSCTYTVTVRHRPVRHNESYRCTSVSGIGTFTLHHDIRLPGCHCVTQCIQQTMKAIGAVVSMALKLCTVTFDNLAATV